MAVNTITFGGVNSADYGIYISGEGVFNAPVRDAKMISIPGRNGSFLLDNGRYENIEVTYPAFNTETNKATFIAQIDAFRNAIASQKGYQRLEDSFHTDEYRMASFIGGMEINPILYNDHTSQFEIVFNCKPQRFLFSGEEVFTLGEWGETKTYSGSIVSFEGDETTAVKSLTAQIVPKQSGSGDPSPSNVRPISGYDTVNIHVSPTTTAGDGTTYPISLGQTVYGGTLDVVSGVLTITKVLRNLGTDQSGSWYMASTSVSGKQRLAVGLSGIKTPNSTVICNTFKTVTGDNIYNGVEGIGTDSNDRLLFYKSDLQTVADWKSWATTNNLTVVYELATPTEVTLTPTEVNTLLGQNNIWADSGEVEVTIGQDPNVLINPTKFESNPLLMVQGYGTLNIGDEGIRVDRVEVGNLLLSNGVQLKDTSTGTLANEVTIGVVEFDQAKLNTGDIITLQPTTYTINITENNLSPSYHIEAEVTSQSGAGESSAGVLSRATATYTVNIASIPFTVGTAGSVQHSASWIYRSVSIYGGYSEDTFPMVFNIAYDGANKITITAKHWYHAGATVQTTGSTGDLTGYSSVLVSGTIYIDLDIGEAYWIKNGTVISANYTVHLGAELPTLKPGVNNITYTTGITSLKIVPRWWKI